MLTSEVCSSDGEEQRATMTTYRPLCCNDLLRLGPINLQFTTITFFMNYYMKSMAMWPGNCLVADTEGGRLAGYILGSVQGEGEETAGFLSVISLRSMDMIDLGKQLSKLLEDCCDKIYRAFTMKFFSTHSNLEKHLANELGYVEYKKHLLVFEFMKPLPLSIKITKERIRRRAGQG